MNRMKKAAFAVCTGLAFAAVGGCASTQGSGLASTDATPARVEQPQVLRPLNSYGTMGGYRYRRFAAVAAAS
jgi:hypothetical protein